MDLSRQMSVFAAEKFKDKRIDVIGGGAVGSHIVVGLAKIGLTNIHVWDYDVVKPHNLPNQAFFMSHVDAKEVHEEKMVRKVDALAEVVKAMTGVEITVHPEKYQGQEKLGPIVFLLVDKMDERKIIWETSLKLKLNVECLIETRMGARAGRVYTLYPCQRAHYTEWEKTLCKDEDVERSACGTIPSIQPTASLVASTAVWQLIHYLNKGWADISNEIIFMVDPWFLAERKF